MTDYPEFNNNWSEAVRVAWLNNYRHDPSEAPNIERIQPIAPMSFANYPIKNKPAAPADDEATANAMKDVARKVRDKYFEMTQNAFIEPPKRWELLVAFTMDAMIPIVGRGEVPGLPSPDEHAALKAEVERLRASENAQLAHAKETIVALTVAHGKRVDERDAAIARADAAERKLRDAYTQIREDPIDTNKVIEDLSNAVDRERAAHAEAMELLRRAEDIEGNARECRQWFDDREAHLAKHQNKDASK
jgi:hypothetical protein